MKAIKKRTIKYNEEPIEDIRIIKDFLPKPKDLVLKDESIKVTLALSKASVNFFKNEAKKNHSQYQKMIRSLLDQYMILHKKDKEGK